MSVYNARYFPKSIIPVWRPGVLGTFTRVMAQVFRAVFRARMSILTIAATYALFVAIGIVLAHAGNRYALSSGDEIVGQALKQDPAAIADQRGDKWRAALLDGTRNLLIGAVPKTIAGLSVVFPYPLVAYQGWVGGIVSVRGNHTSRLTNPFSATYYFVTLILPLIPYSLAAGAGVNAGIAMFRPATYYQGEKWLSIFPAESLRDIARIYILVVPLFVLASLWEFLSPWNL